MLVYKRYKDLQVFLTEDTVLLIHNETRLHYFGSCKIGHYSHYDILMKIFCEYIDSSYCFIKETVINLEKEIPKVKRMLKIMYSLDDVNYELLLNEVN
jgi:hypothetical protein